MGVIFMSKSTDILFKSAEEQTQQDSEVFVAGLQVILPKECSCFSKIEISSPGKCFITFFSSEPHPTFDDVLMKQKSSSFCHHCLIFRKMT
jgi:hypothetical protein